MKSRMNDERGFALVFGMVILVLATVGGTALLFMTQKDRTEASDYAKMRSTSQVAIAALKACEGQFRDAPAVVVDILKGYIAAPPTPRWLLGTAANATTEQRISLGNGTDAPQYSARIVGYDNNLQYLIIEGTGYNGAEGKWGKKRVTATYQLAGLAMVTPPAAGTYYGLCLGGAIENLNTGCNFYADVYFKMTPGPYTNDNVIQNSPTTFYGNLKTGASTTAILVLGTTVSVKKNAYFQCKVKQNQALTVDGKAGFEQPFVALDNQMQLKDKSFFNSIASTNPNTMNSTINMNGKTIYRLSSGIPATKFTSCAAGSPIAKAAAMIDLDDSLGLSTTSDAYAVTLPASFAAAISVQSVSNTVTVSSFETWFNARTASQLYLGKYLVVKQTGMTTVSGSGTFTKKMIWITNGFSLTSNTIWADCDLGSNTFIYVNGTSGYLNGWGIPNSKNFRGVIYENSDYVNSGTQNYKFGTSTKFYGAIIHTKGRFDINSGGPLNLYCDNSTDGLIGKAAVDEFVTDGILTLPGGGGGGGGGTPVLTLTDLKIRPTLLGMQL